MSATLDIPKFKTWLQERGSEMHAPTNPYEVLRFVTPDGIGIIHRSDAEPISAINSAAQKAVEAFKTSAAWRPIPATNRKNGKTRTEKIRASLKARDGDGCVYCGMIIPDEVKSKIEHVVPVTAGGTNHLANLALACLRCETMAGTKSAAEKIKLAIRRHGERAKGCP